MHVVRNFNKFSASGRDSPDLPLVQKTLQTKCTTDSKSLQDAVYSDNNPTEKKIWKLSCDEYLNLLRKLK